MAKEAFVALVTCFNDDETINYDATRAQVRRQVEAGNNIMCAGTNGDFTALTFDEKVRLTGEVVDEVGGRARVIVNAGMPATYETVLLARDFEHIGVDGIAVITPFFIACTQDGLIRHFSTRRRRGDDAGLPLRHPGPHPEPYRARDRADARGPRQHRRHQGLRRSARRRSKPTWRSDARSTASTSIPAPTTWCSGRCRTAPAAASPGSATSCREVLAGIVSAFNAGDIAEAERQQERFGAFRKDLYGLGYPPALVKRALYLMDNSVGASRQPALLPDPAQDAKIAAILQKHGLITKAAA